MFKEIKNKNYKTQKQASPHLEIDLKLLSKILAKDDENSAVNVVQNDVYWDFLSRFVFGIGGLMEGSWTRSILKSDFVRPKITAAVSEIFTSLRSSHELIIGSTGASLQSLNGRMGELMFNKPVDLATQKVDIDRTTVVRVLVREVSDADASDYTIEFTETVAVLPTTNDTINDDCKIYKLPTDLLLLLVQIDPQSVTDVSIFINKELSIAGRLLNLNISS